MEKFKFISKDKIDRLPKTSGVYCFKKERQILYIGKAINLRERVKNHQGETAFDKSERFGFIKTDSEIEALILEAQLIKKYLPKHNVVWKDSKNYFYVAITKEPFPRLLITHQPKNNRGTSFIGPFVDGRALKETLKILRKVFPYRTCVRLPQKSCLWHHLDRCLAPCSLNSKTAEQIPSAKKNLSQECQRNIKSLSQILQGKKTQVLSGLKKEMKTLSKAEKFEQAGRIRNQIHALEKVMAHSRIIEETNQSKLSAYHRLEAYDISNIQGQEATGSMVVFTEGRPDKAEYRKFKIKISDKPNDTAMIKEVLGRRLKHKEWPYPDLILIDGGKPQLGAAKQIVSKIPLVALAKKHNELFIDSQKEPVLLKSLGREMFNLILRARDEAHRFALSYHHKLRKKSLLD